MKEANFFSDLLAPRIVPPVVLGPVELPAAGDSGHRSPYKRRPWIRAHARKFGLLVGLSVVAASLAWGQQNATVSGTITDTSGGVIAGATVQVTNVNTGVTVTAVTNSTGYYRVENLIPGQYTVTAEMKGFSKAVRSQFTLQVAQSAEINLTLQVGEVTQAVEVTGVSPMLQTKSAEVGQVIQRQEVTDLPLNDRNYLKLALLAPGTSSYYGRTFFNSALTDNIGSVNVGGQGEDRNAFLLDGGDVKAYMINISYVPSIDAIQEFKIETTPYAADLGTSPGAQIIVTTRSGTNKFHGSAWEFLRNQATDARDFFAPTKPELRKNQFGGAVGGPIKKDRLFFFTNYEGFRERIGETFNGTVPTMLMRQGNFSELGHPIFDPMTTQPCSSCPTGLMRTPFPNNVIPPNRLDPAALFFLQSIFPAPTSSGLLSGGGSGGSTVSGGVTAGGSFVGSNFSSVGVDKFTRNQFNVRIDYTAPNGKDVVYGRFSMNNSTDDLAMDTFSSSPLPGFGDNFILNQRTAVLHDAHTFNPTTVLEGMVTFYRSFPSISPKQLGNAVNAKLGIKGVRQDEPADISLSGFTPLWSNPFAPEFFLTNQYQYLVKLTKIFGKHTFKLGAEYDRWQMFENHAPRFPMGLYSFDGEFTQDPNAPAATGSGAADFALGFPTSGQTIQGDDSAHWFRNNARWWFNDEVRVNPDLTLNLGVRYEYDGPGFEKFNRLDNFDLNTGTVLLAGTDVSILGNNPKFFGFPVQRTSRGTVNKDLNNYAPRIGFAYKLPGHENTVLRGGYGVFYDVIQLNILNDTRANFPFAVFPNLVVPAASEVVPSLSWENVFAPGSSLTVRPSFKAQDPNLQNGFTQQASLTIEHQFARPFLVSIGGKWLKNTRYFDQEDKNLPLQNGTFVRPFPQLQSLTLLDNDQYGHYDALLAKIQSQAWHGLTSIIAFTWSKSLDDTSAGSASIGAPGEPGHQNRNCIRCDFGRSVHDFERRLSQSWVYTIPTIPLRLSDSHPRLVENTLGGWEFSGVLTLQSGFPVTPLVSFDNSESLTFADHADVVPGVPVFGPGNRDPFQWFNPAAFTVAPRGHFGNAGRDIIEGPGIITLDLGLMKNFKITESVALQFRSEFFNITNHPNFADPFAGIDIPSLAGRIFSTSTNPRQMQFSLRITF